MIVPLLLLALGAGGAQAAEVASQAEILLRHGQVAEALVAATERVRAAPDDLDAQELYIDLLLVVGYTGRVLGETRSRVESAPNEPAAWYLLGRAEPDPEAARKAYERALRLEPRFARAYMGIGAVNEGQDRPAEALAAYVRALSFDPTLSEAWLGRVRMSLLLGNTADALAAAREGLQSAPLEPGLALSVAHLDPASARAVLEAAVVRIPDDARLPAALGAVLLEAGDAAGAVRLAEQALAIDGTLEDAGRLVLVGREIASGRLDLKAWRQLVELRTLETTDPKAARAGYGALVAGFPRSALVLLGRASAIRAAGGAPDSALTDVLAAVRADPTNMEATAVAGLALLETGRAPEALPLLTQVTAERPWDASLGLARATALQQVGQRPEASVLLASIADAHRLDAAAQLAYADDLLRSHRIDEAYLRLKQTLLLVPDPRLAAAFVQVAPAAGHPDEAAALLEQVVAQTGNPALAEAARRLREAAPK